MRANLLLIRWSLVIFAISGLVVESWVVSFLRWAWVEVVLAIICAAIVVVYLANKRPKYYVFPMSQDRKLNSVAISELKYEFVAPVSVFCHHYGEFHRFVICSDVWVDIQEIRQAIQPCNSAYQVVIFRVIDDKDCAAGCSYHCEEILPDLKGA